MLTITPRPLTPRELQYLNFSLKMNLGGLLLVIWGVILLGLGGRNLVDWAISRELSPFVRWAIWAVIVSATTLPWAFNSIVSLFRKIHLDIQDRRAKIVEQIHVTSQRAMVLENLPHTFAIELGDGQILLLSGRQMDNETIFSLEKEKEGVYRRFDEGPEIPLRFPSTEFVIERFPHSKKIVPYYIAGNERGPKTMGEFLPPETKTLKSKLSEDDLNDCEILPGSLENLQLAFSLR